MVMTMRISHIFKYPMELVVQTHLTKYPTEKEKNVLHVQEIERIESNGIEYLRRIAVCLNVIPPMLRKIAGMDVSTIKIEEQCWIDRRHRKFRLESQNLTWASHARLFEESFFEPVQSNAHWTKFEQTGIIDIHGLGRLGRALELFAHHFLQKGVQKSLKIMEDLLQERARKHLANAA